MAGADYHHCSSCDRKTFYDSDVSYGGHAVLSLCEECLKSKHLAVVDGAGKPIGVCYGKGRQRCGKPLVAGQVQCSYDCDNEC